MIHLFLLQGVCQCWPFCRGATLRFLSGVWFHLKLTEWSRAAQNNSPEHLKVHTNTGLYFPLKASDKASRWMKRCTVREEEKVGREGISTSRGKERRQGLCCAFRQSFHSNTLYKSKFSLTVTIVFFCLVFFVFLPWSWLISSDRCVGFAIPLERVRERQRGRLAFPWAARQSGVFTQMCHVCWALRVRRFWRLQPAGFTTLLDTRCDLYNRSSEPPHRLDTWQRHWTQRGHQNINIHTAHPSNSESF